MIQIIPGVPKKSGLIILNVLDLSYSLPKAVNIRSIIGQEFAPGYLLKDNCL